MNVIIHDLLPQQWEAVYGGDVPGTDIVSDNGTIRKCNGCFGCWILTPGQCVIRDEYNDMGERLSRCEELIIVSQCIYGSYSPFVLNVLNRSIPYVLPYFATVNGETHHKQRYPQSFRLTVHFYGEDLRNREMETARKLVEANALNWAATGTSVHFHTGYEAVKEALA